MSLVVYARRNIDPDADRPATLAVFDVKCIDLHISVRGTIERAISRLRNTRVELFADTRDLILVDAIDIEHLQQFVDPARSGAVDVAFGNNLMQRLLHPSAGLQKPIWKIAL